MLILAIDTSTGRAAVALGRPGAAPRVAPVGPEPRHGRGLVPAISALLEAEGARPADLAAVAVGLGPGSYTGLRIGLTAAKVLAFAASRPLVGLDSLEAIARSAPGEALRVAVAADAQRGDAYVAEFARDGPGGPLLRLGPTRIARVDAWAAALDPATLVLGPALDRLPVDWPAGLRRGTADQGHPGGAGLLGLAFEAFGSGRRDDPYFVEPAYLRRSAAEDQWEART